MVHRKHRKAIAHLREVDPTLSRIIDRVGRCDWAPRATGTHFDALVRSIIYQQLSGKAAATIHRRLETLTGERAPTPTELLALPDGRLRAAGLSRQKISYLRDLAARVEADEVPLSAIDELHDDAVIAALVGVKGIGRWTAQMFLMFRLGRPDVLPELDLGIRKAIRIEYRKRAMPTSVQVQRTGARWSPYCSVASWYLWRSLDNGGGQLSD